MEANTNKTFLAELILVLCFANLLKKWKSQVAQHDGVHGRSPHVSPGASLGRARIEQLSLKCTTVLFAFDIRYGR